MSKRRQLSLNPSTGIQVHEEYMPAIVQHVHEEDGRYSVQYSHDGTMDSNMPKELLKRYEPPIYTLYDPVEVRLELGKSGPDSFMWGKGIIADIENSHHHYKVLLLNGTLKMGVSGVYFINI